MTSYEPYVPCDRLRKILNEYCERLGITRDEMIMELCAQTGKKYDTWARRIYGICSGEQEAVRFQTADEILTSLYLIDRWYTELDDLYQAA